MLKAILFEVILPLLAALFLITQLVLPIFLKDLEFLWLFKKSKPKQPKPEQPKPFQDLSELEQKAVEKTAEYKEVLGALDETEQKISNIRGKTKIN